MNLKTSEEGFIFTLDATLAILVSLLALASVASTGSSLKTHEQFGRLRLQKIGQDAIRVLSEKGVFESAVLAMEGGNISKAERVIRENINEIMPEHIQFRVFIRNQLSVYPTTNSNWNDLYENIEDRTVTNFQYSVPAKENYFRVLAWTPENREEKLTENINDMRPLWYTKKTEEENSFRENIQKKGVDNNDYEYYNAVFIPDADIQFSKDTIDALKEFAKHGRLVVAGDTLYNNQDTVHENNYDLTPTFGIYDDDDGPNYNDVENEGAGVYTSYDYTWDMYAQPVEASELDHPILYGLTPVDSLTYEGDYVYHYDDFVDYHPSVDNPIYPDYEPHDSDPDPDYDKSTAKVLTNWGPDQEDPYYITPEDQNLYLSGLIVNKEDDWTGAAIFINGNVVQTVDRGASPYKWLRLTANSISGTGGYKLFHNPITISLWRGEGL